MAHRNINVTDADIAMANQVRRLLLSVLAVPAGPLEHLVQLAHETNGWQRQDPPEIFAEQGVTAQTLRMLWHFRCNLEAVMPREARR